MKNRVSLFHSTAKHGHEGLQDILTRGLDPAKCITQDGRYRPPPEQGYYYTNVMWLSTSTGSSTFRYHRFFDDKTVLRSDDAAGFFQVDVRGLDLNKLDTRFTTESFIPYQRLRPLYISATEEQRAFYEQFPWWQYGEVQVKDCLWYSTKISITIEVSENGQVKKHVPVPQEPIDDIKNDPNWTMHEESYFIWQRPARMIRSTHKLDFWETK